MTDIAGEGRRTTRPAATVGHQPEPEHLPCPRCDSTNTKFCYYNNYNLSQPRHFCKSCRRYWTQGGTLRNIPVGGGTRKNSKRSRTATTAAITSSTVSPSHDPIHPASLQPICLPPEPTSFTSLLTTPGFLGLGSGFGLGLGSGFDELGFGLGRNSWPFQDLSDPGSGIGANSGQFGGENGFSDGDCFSWPELAISMPGKSLK